MVPGLGPGWYNFLPIRRARRERRHQRRALRWDNLKARIRDRVCGVLVGLRGAAQQRVRRLLNDVWADKEVTRNTWKVRVVALAEACTEGQLWKRLRKDLARWALQKAIHLWEVLHLPLPYPRPARAPRDAVS